MLTGHRNEKDCFEYSRSPEDRKFTHLTSWTPCGQHHWCGQMLPASSKHFRSASTWLIVQVAKGPYYQFSTLKKWSSFRTHQSFHEQQSAILSNYGFYLCDIELLVSRRYILSCGLQVTWAEFYGGQCDACFLWPSCTCGHWAERNPRIFWFSTVWAIFNLLLKTFL